MIPALGVPATHLVGSSQDPIEGVRHLRGVLDQPSVRLGDGAALSMDGPTDEACDVALGDLDLVGEVIAVIERNTAPRSGGGMSHFHDC